MKIKSVLAAMLAGIMALSMIGCTQSAEPATSSESTSSADAAAEGKTATFQILFTSDIHGSFTNFNYATGKETVGSLSRIATVIKEEKDYFDGTTLVIDVGDAIQGNGTSFFINNDDFTPFPVVNAFNVIGYDIATLGNHEFNFGIDAMYKAYTGFDGAKLNANVTHKADGAYLTGFEPYAIYNIDGLRVAVIAVVTPNIELWDKNNMEKDGLQAASASETVRGCIDKLEAEDLADIYVVAAHMGETGEYGREGSGAIDVAQKNPEIAVVLGAHYHTITGTRDNQLVLDGTEVKFAENKNAGGSVGKVLITSAFENGEWVLKDKGADYDTSSVKTDVIEITEDIAKDADVEAAIAEADAKARDYVNNTVVGALEGGPLVPEPEIAGTYQAYFQDTALSDLINNVMLEATGADISGTAPLDTNANHQPGEITVGGVAQIYKYDNNTLYKLSMTGSQILQWMEWSYGFFGSTINGQPDPAKPAVNLETDLTIPYGTMQGYNHDQFAGIIYEVDLTKPVGERITVISMADGSPFELDKEYIVAANDYRSNTQLMNNSETGVFKPGEATATLIESDVQTAEGLTSMMDLIIEYIQKQPNQTITNSCDNNFTFINLDWDAELRAKAIEAINTGSIQTDFKTPVTKEEVLALS